MHELALCRAVIDSVTSHVGNRSVRVVHLRIGHLRQVVPDVMQFHWELCTADGSLAGATLDIAQVPAEVHCRGCGATSELDVPILLCAACDGADVELVAGEEFLVESVELESGS